MSIIQLTSALIINVGVQSVIDMSDPIRLLFEKLDLDKEKMEPPKPVSTAADVENRTFKFGNQTEFVEVETMPPDNDRVWVRFRQYGEGSESIVEFVSNHLKSWNCELDEKNEAFELKDIEAGGYTQSKTIIIDDEDSRFTGCLLMTWGYKEVGSKHPSMEVSTWPMEKRTH